MNHSSIDDESLRLEMRRHFKAPRERVFAAFSSFDSMSRWFGPPGCEVEEGEVDFRVGGRYRLAVRTARGLMVVGGEYREISPPRRLCFSWKWEPNPETCDLEMEVDIEFSEIGVGETELRLIQMGFPNRQEAERHNQGWTATFEKLGPILD